VATGISSLSALSPYPSVPAQDQRSRLVVNSWLNEERLIAAALPTDWSARSLQTTGDALDSLVSALAKSEYLADLTGPERITRAIATANRTVLEANRSRCGTETEKYCGVGLAVAIRSGKTVTIAMVPPVQVLLFQDAGPRWLPSRESWVEGADGLDGQPLGWSESIRPTVVSAAARDNDELVITTASVGAALAVGTRSLSSATAICQQIDALCGTNALDAFEVVAVSTRFAPQGVVRTMRNVTGNLFGSVDRRARSLIGNQRIND
jgi:hypothetical protein